MNETYKSTLTTILQGTLPPITWVLFAHPTINQLLQLPTLAIIILSGLLTVNAKQILTGHNRLSLTLIIDGLTLLFMLLIAKNINFLATSLIIINLIVSNLFLLTKYLTHPLARWLCFSFTYGIAIVLAIILQASPYLTTTVLLDLIILLLLNLFATMPSFFNNPLLLLIMGIGLLIVITMTKGLGAFRLLIIAGLMAGLMIINKQSDLTEQGRFNLLITNQLLIALVI